MESPLTSHPGAATLKAAGTSLSHDECLASADSVLAGRVVVITGESSLLPTFLRTSADSYYSAKVAASDLAQASVDAVVDEIKKVGGTATGVVCDVTDWDQQVKMFRHAINVYGAVDVAVVNAGLPEIPGWLSDKVGPDGEPKKPSFATLDVNVVGAAYTANLAFYHLNQNPSKDHKAIVVLGSMSSFLPIPGAPLYTLSKHAMLGFARSLHYNGLTDGINVNIVCPWFVHTPILGTSARLAIAGLPLATVPDVVDAMVYASTVKNSGLSLCVDPSGVLSVPHEAFDLGSEGFYHVFEMRAKGAISTARFVKDAIAAFKHSAVGGNAVFALEAIAACGVAFLATKGVMSAMGWSQLYTPSA
ncbi:hypothetical protein RQP46_002712 [Phenoliferia psychrophenolica]